MAKSDWEMAEEFARNCRARESMEESLWAGLSRERCDQIYSDLSSNERDDVYRGWYDKTCL